jgi:prephenate dehydratase
MSRPPIRVAFQGERGAFSEVAARQLLGSRVLPVPRPTFPSLFRAIRDGAAQAILAPIENSLAGGVTQVYDLLLASRLSITGEVVLPIALFVIGCPGARLADVNTIYSHPVALAQCERFFAARAHIRRVAADDTAGSVYAVLARGDRTCAALAGRYAARFYGGRILYSHAEDHARNFTRFVLLEPEVRLVPRANKLSLVIELAHRPGSLLRALEPFALHGLNLLKIESRPIPGRPWEYRFFLDARAQCGPKLTEALKRLKRSTTRIRVLGHYVSE